MRSFPCGHCCVLKSERLGVADMVVGILEQLFTTASCVCMWLQCKSSFLSLHKPRNWFVDAVDIEASGIGRVGTRECT